MLVLPPTPNGVRELNSRRPYSERQCSFKNLEMPPSSCQSRLLHLSTNVSLSYPPGRIPIGLCLRGEPRSIFLRGVGQWGWETGGQQGPVSTPNVSAVFIFIFLFPNRHPPPLCQPLACSLYLWLCFYFVSFIHLFCVSGIYFSISFSITPSG